MIGKQTVGLLIVILVAVMLLPTPGRGQSVALGNLAYPATATMVQGSCAGVYKTTVVNGRLQQTYVACPKGLTDPDLSVIARDVGPEDVIRLDYRIPIRNRPGPDVTVAQTFGGGDAISRIGDAWISANGVDWVFLSHEDFVDTGLQNAFFDGKSEERFAIHEVEVDLSDLGIAPRAEVTTLYLRGEEYTTGTFEWIPNFVWVLGLRNEPRPQLVVLAPDPYESISGMATYRARAVGFEASKVIVRLQGSVDAVNALLCVIESPPFKCEFDTTLYYNHRYSLFSRAIGTRAGAGIVVTERVPVRVRN